MPYPVVTFQNLNELIAYVNTYIVTNGVGAIEGVEHNAIENGLAQFIAYSPLNSTLVEIVNTSASKQVTHGITYFMTSVPSSVVFADNFWNEWVFINSTSSDIPFSSGLGYFDLSFTFQTTIPAKSLLRISKATNGLWVQTGTYGGVVGSAPFLKNYPQFVVGSAGSPMAAGDDTLTIPDDLVIPESDLGRVESFADGELQPEDLENIQNIESVTIINNPKRMVIKWKQGLPEGAVMKIKYPINFNMVINNTSPVEVIYSAVLDGAVTETLVDPDGNIFPIPLSTQGRLFFELAGQDQDGNKFAGEGKVYATNVLGEISIGIPEFNLYEPYSGGDMYSNILISADSDLGGVKIEATGFDGTIITIYAKFKYNYFSL